MNPQYCMSICHKKDLCVDINGNFFFVDKCKKIAILGNASDSEQGHENRFCHSAWLDNPDFDRHFEAFEQFDVKYSQVKKVIKLLEGNRLSTIISRGLWDSLSRVHVIQTSTLHSVLCSPEPVSYI
jgi:hypothetical protein